MTANSRPRITIIGAGLVGSLLATLLAQRASGDLADHDVYLCGPPQMIDACLEVLSARGVPAAQIHFDKFLDSGHAAAALHGSAVAEAGSG